VVETQKHPRHVPGSQPKGILPAQTGATDRVLPQKSHL